MVKQITTIAKIGDSATTEDVDGEEREVGSSRVVLKVTASDGADYTLDTNGVYFQFNRSTGAFKKISGGQIGGDYTIKNIYMTGGGLTETLTLHGITGKITED